MKQLVKNGANTRLKTRESARTAYEVACLRERNAAVAVYLNTMMQGDICLIILTAIIMERLSKKSPIKLLKVDQIKSLREFLA